MLMVWASFEQKIFCSVYWLHLLAISFRGLCLSLLRHDVLQAAFTPLDFKKKKTEFDMVRMWPLMLSLPLVISSRSRPFKRGWARVECAWV